MDSQDGSWDDYLTDVPAANGMREVRLAYTPHGPAGSPPYPDWVQPTIGHIRVPGPLQLRTDVGPGPGPDPTPEPTPPPNNDEILQKLDAQMQVLLGVDAKVNALAIQANENTEKIQQQLHQIVEDAEATLEKFVPMLIALLKAADDDGSGFNPIDQWLASRKKGG
jgi:hypothetical protein